ncbi:hypothetical protein BKA66DRAFT_571667 [Pyrenochaeta sp. MPI-SDFR-AT-0127]|nr:hypothetical protein BKA66DRAFT_571667 [Pyrenochaeta sp. MPI-SDFR-AT-0127]
MTEFTATVLPEIKTKLEHLPNELLLQIMDCLPTSTLKVAVVVCKAIRTIVEESLYKHVSIAPSQLLGSQRSYSTLLFLKTLLARPDLAGIVKSLAMWIEDDRATEDVTTIAGLMIPGSVSVGISYSAAELAVTVLSILPAVERLQLDVTSLRSNDTGPLRPAASLFTASHQHEIKLVSTFTNVRSLVWAGPEVSFSLASLPNLESLTLPKHSMFFRSAEHHEISNITTLSLKTDTRILLPATQPISNKIQYLSVFLEGCLFLKKLVIAINDVPMFVRTSGHLRAHRGRQGHIDTLIELLAESIPALEDLEIVLDQEENNWWLDHIIPVTVLKDLARLKSVKIPQQGLVGGDQPGTSIVATSISELLPESLERLELLYPSENVFEFFDRLIQERHDCPKLDQVVIHCATFGRGLPFRQLGDGIGMQKLWETNLVSKQLREVGIETELRGPMMHA